jgi:hypothetical protein
VVHDAVLLQVGPNLSVVLPAVILPLSLVLLGFGSSQLAAATRSSLVRASFASTPHQLRKQLT